MHNVDVYSLYPTKIPVSMKINIHFSMSSVAILEIFNGGLDFGVLAHTSSS